MEDTAISIIKQWKEENGYVGEIPISSVKVKHCDYELGIYTLYFYTESTLVKIKAIIDESDWKIIELK